MPRPKPDDLLTTKDVADLLGIRPPSLHHHMQRGRIKPTQRLSNGHLLFRRSDVVAFKKELRALRKGTGRWEGKTAPGVNA